MLSIVFRLVMAWWRIVNLALLEQIVELYFLNSTSIYFSARPEFLSRLFEMVHVVYAVSVMPRVRHELRGCTCEV
jgi:hypothetical protein